MIMTRIGLRMVKERCGRTTVIMVSITDGGAERESVRVCVWC